MSKPKRVDADQLIRDSYEGSDPRQQGAFSEDTLASVPHVVDKETPDSILTGGDVDAARSRTDAGEETVGGSAPTPDQDVVDELGEAVGITYEDNEPLRFDDKVAERDAHRWELNPASSEEYQDRLHDLSSKESLSPKPKRRPLQGSKQNKDRKTPTTPRARKTSKKKG